MRKIAYLTPLYFGDESCVGGGERYPLNMARGVVEASKGDCAVEMISFGSKRLEKALSDGVTLRVLKAAPPSSPLDSVSWELPDALDDADLVHIHQAYTRCSEVGLLVAKQLRKPICVTDHGGQTSILGLQLGSLELADLIVAQSDFAASLIHARTRKTVIKGGVDAEHFTPSTRRLAREHVLCVARLLPHKGIDKLIQAVPRDLPLVVCGRPYHAEYLKLLRDLAKTKNVKFVTDADDSKILDLYRRAWANVLPSVYLDCYGQSHVAPELMGFTLLEAAACGVPAICPNVAAMPEFVRDGETGFVYENPTDLTEKLTRLAKEPALVEAMGRRGREVVEAEFDLKVAGYRLLEAYRSLTTLVGEAAA